MDTILYDALNNSLSDVLTGVLAVIGGMVLVLVTLVVLFAVSAVLHRHDANHDAPDGDDIPTADGEPRVVADGAWYLVNAGMEPLSPLVAAAAIAGLQEAWAARQENGHE